ncbi:tol-pal system protein YbgF [Desulfovibrio sp. OttesenSCG-928-C14]|nr:tol-pal system protein YbgF [Desulfovibrio sp. OttesenSCG-928-C14]
MPVLRFRILLIFVLALPLFACASTQDAAKVENIQIEQKLQEIRLGLVEEKIESLNNQFVELSFRLAELAAPPQGTDTRKSSSPGSASGQSAPKAAAGPERQAYDAALRAAMDKQPQKAEALFNEFLQKYPESSLLPNAEYWLGESYYTQKRYSEAVLLFLGVASAYPKHNKAPDALLKAGYTYERLGDKENAVFYFSQLLENYPKANSANLARRALQRLGR